MKLSLRKKIIILTITMLVFVTLAASIISTYEIQKYYKDRILEQMSAQLDEIEYLLAHTELVNTIDVNYSLITGFARHSNMRLTMIDSTGLVLFDSNISRDSLTFVENHLYRPEMQMSLRKGLGFDKRLSATIHESMFYTAKLMGANFKTKPFLIKVKFLRLAIPLEEVDTVLGAVRWKIFGGGIIALIFLSIISFYVSSKLTYPIHKLTEVAVLVKKGNLEARFEHNRDDEIGNLTDFLNEMLDKLRSDLVRMKKLEKMRSQFLGNVSHELRTPIFTIQGYLETMMNNIDCDAKTQQKFVKKAFRQSVRLNNLLTDLIDISRIESGEMKMSFAVFNAKKWLRKIVSELQEMADDQKVKLVFLNEESKSVYVNGDKSRLKQVITNLVENAIKYNVPGGSVAVGFAEKDEIISIYVSDTGHGIEAEHLNRIFERFYRVDKERSRDVGGTGLGLAIVKHIVEAHKSKIHVSSQVDKGSTFSFSLDKAEKPADDEPVE